MDQLYYSRRRRVICGFESEETGSESLFFQPQNGLSGGVNIDHACAPEDVMSKG